MRSNSVKADCKEYPEIEKAVSRIENYMSWFTKRNGNNNDQYEVSLSITGDKTIITMILVKPTNFNYQLGHDDHIKAMMHATTISIRAGKRIEIWIVSDRDSD